jgi:hypothetical protein
MIVIFTRNGRSCPRVVCDVCERPITDAQLGAAIFPQYDLEGKEQLAVLHAHKGRCHDLAESRLGGRTKTLWQELRKHLLYLVCNAGMTPEELCALDERDRWVLEP